MWRMWRVIDPRKAIVLTGLFDCLYFNIDSPDSNQWRSVQHQQLASRYGQGRSGESTATNAALPQK
jgi:hypothetical protein